MSVLGKKILLINPPSPFLLDERVFLPLAHAQLAAILEVKEHKVDVLDLAGYADFVEKTLFQLKKETYDFVGLSATTPQFQYAIQILREIKKEYPSMPVILGGPHATVIGNLRRNILENIKANPEMKDHPHVMDLNIPSLEEFDKIIEGEGEALLESAFSHEGEKWVGPGMVPKAEGSKYLSDLPFPDREKFDFASYKWELEDRDDVMHKGTNVMDQRGCPFGCYFCSGRNTAVYRVARQRRPEHVVAELDFLSKKYGLRAFMFYDDEFNVNKDYTIELCNLLKGKNYVLRGFVKSELFIKFPEVAEAMAAAGFVEVCTGVEDRKSVV